MSLKKIEIYGFKSFADHTVIEIDDNQNFVCIVGPNGCGKSNISDAIRWVLGEASAKQIRGTSMQDVIFSGSEKVKPMNFAEVTLYFDNPERENGQRVFNYSGEEFSIGRKIFRSKGDNKYYFNNMPCRRSEIMALFRDTGAGKDGFSIVGQGRISDIIISKNTDRRKIFDEAAGVSNDKTRKRDAQRKLEDTNQNLRLLESNYDYYAEDIQRLEEEVEKANRYLEVTNKIKDLEINYFIHIKESIDSDKAKIQKDIDNNKDYLEKQEAGAGEVKRKLARLDQESVEIDENTERAYNLRQELSVSSLKRDNEYQNHVNLIKNKQDTLNKLTADKNNVVESVDKLGCEFIELQVETDELKNKKSDGEIEVSKLNAEFSVLSEDVESLQKEIDFYNEKRLSGVEDIGIFKSKEASASATINVLQENIASEELKIEDSKKQISELNAKLEDLTKKISDNLQNLDLAIRENKLSVQKSNEYVTLKNNLLGEYNELIRVVAVQENNVARLTEKLKDERGYNKVTRAVLDRVKTDPSFRSYVLGAVGDLFTVDDKFYEAINACLGGSVNNIITDDRRSSQKVLEYVKSLHIGRLTTYPLCDIQGERLPRMYQSVLDLPGVLGLACDLIDYDSRYDNIYTHLLGKIVVVDNFDTASGLRNRYPRCFKMVTLNGEYFDVSGSISGGDNKSGTDQQLKTARAEYESNKAKLLRISAEHKSYDEEKEKIAKKIEQLRTLIEDYKIKNSNLTSEKNNVQTLLDSAKQSLGTAQGQLAVIKKRLEEKQREITDAKTQSGAVSSDRSNIDTIIEDRKRVLDEKKKEYDALSGRIKELEIGLSNMSVSLTQKLRDLDTTKRAIGDKNALVESLNTDIANMTDEIAELEKNKPAIVLTEEENKKIGELQAEIDRYKERKNEIGELRKSLNFDLENFNERIVKASKDLSAFETKLQSIDNEVNEWSNTIETEYGLTYETALPYKREDYEHSKTKSELTKLTALKNRMGAVNLNAEETYKQKKQEFDALKTSLEDAKKARDDTTLLLVKITEEIDKKFGLAFDSIANYFQTTFEDLFGGGKAELILTPSDQEGEDDGVDIAVTLPGKSKKSLSLLSGGEQTLTAIAIIFAILRHRSSPFVILDEVESALDESNCVRFAMYLKEFSKIARFIVISHKKPTMENADVLYGVTMMRPGISNIVSVSMSEAQKMSEDN